MRVKLLGRQLLVWADNLLKVRSPGADNIWTRATNNAFIGCGFCCAGARAHQQFYSLAIPLFWDLPCYYSSSRLLCDILCVQVFGSFCDLPHAHAKTNEVIYMKFADVL